MKPFSTDKIAEALEWVMCCFNGHGPPENQFSMGDNPPMD
jgi:hypothetical protein